jgi:hypothetical protein
MEYLVKEIMVVVDLEVLMPCLEEVVVLAQ